MANLPLIVGTDFGALPATALRTWSFDFWKEVRNQSFVTNFLGSGPDSMIQRVSELKATNKGNRAVITLVPNQVSGGVAGDNMLRGKEDTITTQEMEVVFDQYRMAYANKGRMSDQKAVVKFREVAKDHLAYNMAKFVDELSFQTLAGIPYTMNLDGSARTVGEASQLEFASTVTAPTALRRLRWDSTNSKLVTSASTADVTISDKITYKALVMAKAHMVSKRIKGIRINGKETYHVFIDPISMANLKLDPDFLANLRAAAAAVGRDSEIFKGGIPTVDGLVVHETVYAPTTLGASSGSKFGSKGDVEGAFVLICGAQALAFADIDAPYWEEEKQDYGNNFGVSIGKMFGMRKPVFTSSYSNTSEDFGVSVMYVALGI